VQADCPIPPQIQQWLDNERREAAEADKEEEFQDLETDLDNLEQQRSEYQRLQAQADMKPAAKSVKSNDDGDKKMPAKEATTSSAEAAPPSNDIDDDTEAAASAWLRSNMIRINGELQFIDPDNEPAQTHTKSAAC